MCLSNKNLVLIISIVLAFIINGCSSTKPLPKPVAINKEGVVLASKGCTIGEFKDGPKVVSGNVNVPTWDGYQLDLRTDDGKIFKYFSKELYYEGDGVVIKILKDKVIGIKYRP